ncbi:MULTISPECIES: 2,3-epoxybenzoyl-CoA dihydrolase [Pseudofrankia]|uniref:2,3-epoxybenzoyl-CoA dihydrolase n=1 Tax=Pseudofrankia TaxID=2994363 RepID=UPI000234CFE2|nr:MULTISPECIES: 2,3-epoxybenzoyl-CoA dihydrolase [Pseudofrankia]OHV33348.1 benzoyl-CoA-dihydrodiol lyase [Pseudofrankia sp. EUN1h]
MTVTDAATPSAELAGPVAVSFDTEPGRYRHWRLSVDGPVATLALNVDPDGGIVPGYELKMNSYDLGVDIELYDATQRLRFEHPGVKVVVVTSGKERMFCAGANIRMLAQSSHPWKVNFCKFTNETRNGMEDATAHSGQTYLAALNGTAAGGGYELALACEQILLVDDGSSAVSLPEVPLLGVLPGTGGLTRMVDKRAVRRDLADVFATTAEGVRGARAVAWGLVDEAVPPGGFGAALAARVEAAVARSPRPDAAAGIRLTPLRRAVDGDTTSYDHLRVVVDRASSTAYLTVLGPGTGPAATPASLEDVHTQGAGCWPLAVARALDDAVLRLRVNELSVGTWVLRTEGDPAAVAAVDELLLAHRDDWLVNEVIQFWKRTLRRLDASSRSLIALVEPGSCFVGSLLELALAADRQYMLDGEFTEDDDPAPAAVLRLDGFNAGPLPTSAGVSRLAVRFRGDPAALEGALATAGTDLAAAEAARAGLVTATPDDLDWDDEIRLVLSERASFSPDALTGLEANLRFAGPETFETKIFGRLSAWQNWIFQRPNAAGPNGALGRYGTGRRADYDRKRV